MHQPLNGSSSQLVSGDRLPVQAERLTYRDEEVREAVAGFYGGHCRYCGDPATAVDHIIPRAQGGTDSVRNLMAACASCNTRKGDRRLAEAFEAELLAEADSIADLVTAVAERIRRSRRRADRMSRRPRGEGEGGRHGEGAMPHPWKRFSLSARGGDSRAGRATSILHGRLPLTPRCSPNRRERKGNSTMLPSRGCAAIRSVNRHRYSVLTLRGVPSAP